MHRSRKFNFKSLRQYLAYFGLFILGLALGASLLAYLLAGEIYDYEDTVSQDHLPQIDAIVCLGGGRGRIAAAGDLWFRYWESAHQTPSTLPPKVPVLYFSGMGRQANWTLLAKQIRKGISQKIRMEDIVIERESSNTDANARWLIRYAQEHHWNKILLMTSSYHMKRAQFIFDHVLKTQESPIEVETISVYQEPFGAREWRNGPIGVRVTLMEYLKWVYYRAIWRSL
jgi:uncharacterized SAM-binding protein YcdF (DUF218 family)